MFKNITGNTEAKLDTLDALARETEAVMAERSHSGLDFTTQRAQLTAAQITAASARRAIVAATAENDVAERSLYRAKTALIAVSQAILSAENDPRSRKLYELSAAQEHEAIALADEFTPQTSFVSALAQTLGPALALAKSQYLATQVATQQSRVELQSARLGFANAVISFEAALASVRAQLMTLGVKAPTRRKSSRSSKQQPEATESKPQPTIVPTPAVG